MNLGKLDPLNLGSCNSEPGESELNPGNEALMNCNGRVNLGKPLKTALNRKVNKRRCTPQGSQVSTWGIDSDKFEPGYAFSLLN